MEITLSNKRISLANVTGLSETELMDTNGGVVVTAAVVATMVLKFEAAVKIKKAVLVGTFLFDTASCAGVTYYFNKRSR